jgi:hypothetical protein
MAVPAHEVGHVTEVGVDESESVVFDYVVHCIGILVETVQMTFVRKLGHNFA